MATSGYFWDNSGSTSPRGKSEAMPWPPSDASMASNPTMLSPASSAPHSIWRALST